jgi:hypothetical protein
LNEIKKVDLGRPFLFLELNFQIEKHEKHYSKQQEEKAVQCSSPFVSVCSSLLVEIQGYIDQAMQGNS